MGAEEAWPVSVAHRIVPAALLASVRCACAARVIVIRDLDNNRIRDHGGKGSPSGVCCRQLRVLYYGEPIIVCVCVI